MPPVSDAATWRTHPYAYRGYLFILAPTAIFKARVNQASFTYPLYEVPFDNVTLGAFGDVRPGMTITFGSTEGGDDLGRQRVRKAFTSNTAYMGESSRGTRDGELNLADNAYLTVWNDYRVWAKVPRITDTGVMYKDYDLTVGTNTSQPPPVANAGPGYAGLVDPATGKARVTLDGSTSWAVANGATITTYLWAGIDDCNIVTGTVNDASLQIDAPPGFRWGRLTVTDSNGKTHTAYVPIAACDESTFPAISQFDVSEHILEQGQTIMSFVIHEDLPYGTYPDGTLVMYWEEEFYNGAAGQLSGPATRQNVKFVGWHNTEQIGLEAFEGGIRKNTQFQCLTVGGRLMNLPAFPQVVDYDDTPSSWAEMAAFNMERYLWYLLYWHSTALDVADYLQSSSSYLVPGLESGGSSLFEQVSLMAKAIAHELTCDQRGRLRVVENPLLVDTADRVATVIVDLAASDWTKLTFQRQRGPRVHWLDGSGILTGADRNDIRTAFCKAPGRAPGQGLSANSFGNQLIANQTELNARTGHEYARLNSEWGEITLDLINLGDAGIEPALMEWVTLTLDASTNERGWSLSSQRCLPLGVDIQHANDGSGLKTVTLRLFPETIGLPAATVIIPPDPNLPGWTLPDLVWPNPIPFIETTNPDAFSLRPGVRSMVAFNYDGFIYRTTDFETPEVSGGPTWDRYDLDAATIGNILDWCVDPWSPKYVGGGSQINGWIATTKGIYRVADALGATPTATLQFSFAATLGLYQTAHIEFGWGQQNWGVCVIHYVNQAGHTGTWTTYTTDGSNWAAETQITSHYVGVGYTFQPGLFASSRIPGRAYTSALKASGSGAAATSYYITNDHGASWSEVTSPTNFTPHDAFVGDIRAPWDDNADQSIVYAGGISADGSGWIGRQGGYLLRKNADGTISDVTPTYNPGVGTRYFQPGVRWGLQICPDNRQRLILNGWDDPNAYYTSQTFVSANAGATWTRLALLSGISGCVFIGGGGTVLYIWGGTGSLGTGAPEFYYSADFGTTLESKLGNIPTDFPTADFFIGIAGG